MLRAAPRYFPYKVLPIYLPHSRKFLIHVCSIVQSETYVIGDITQGNPGENYRPVIYEQENSKVKY